MIPVRPSRSTSAPVAAAPLPVLERGLRLAILLGGMAVLLVPAARGHSAWLGWMPLWLLGMPFSAWWALHRFALPGRAHASMAPTKPRRLRAQAKRWRPRISARVARAA